MSFLTNASQAMPEVNTDVAETINDLLVKELGYSPEVADFWSKALARKDGAMHTFNENLKGKYSMHMDKKELAKSASLTVGSYFVKGLSLGVNAVEGAIKNEEGNRFKSSVVNVYENTPFSYVETGNELNILEGDIFWLKFKTPNDEEYSENAPNYEYTEPAETPVSIPQQQF